MARCTGAARSRGEGERRQRQACSRREDKPEGEERGGGAKKVREVEGKWQPGGGWVAGDMLWSPLLHQASAWQINTVQLGFFLFLIDIFESVPA